MIWSTSKTFIKNIIESTWDQGELYSLVDEVSIKVLIDTVNAELRQASDSTQIDYSNWKDKDFKNVIAASKARLTEIG